VSTYQPGDRTPITRCSQLTDLFAPHAPREGRVGLELELLPVKPDGHLVPYAGAGGVEEALARLSPPHEAVEEASHITALKPRGGGMVGLEPGAQVEIATPPADSLGELETFLQRTARELETSAAASGFRLAPWGVAPTDGEEDLPDVPKARYGILREHLLAAGSMGRRMMKLTASTQVSFDYKDEADLTRMVHIAATALPYVLAYTANGPVYGGRRTPWATQRPKIWRNTDRKRCGLPAFLFGEQVTYAGAARWAAGRPLILMVRDGRFLPGDGRTFAEWLRNPGERGSITVEDWELHVSTLFPDLRLRSYLEIRVLDALPLPLVMSIAALFKGLFAEAGGRAIARSGLPRPGRTALGRALLQAARHGPRWTPDEGPAPAEAGKALLEASTRGLRSLGEDPARLDPLRDLVSARACPADRWRKGPENRWLGPELHGAQD
jgi:glutamate--cysteine ligase